MRPEHRPRPTKGERTRERIVERAAALFNTQGVAASSMADVSKAVGLEKGGIYNHFASKNSLAIAAFEFAASIVLDRVAEAVAGEVRGWNQLLAIVDIYVHIDEKPFMPGGCPLLNTAVESTDTNGELRTRARNRIEEWRRAIVASVELAVADGDVEAADALSIGTMTISAIEGGVMLSRVYRETTHIKRVANELVRYLETYRSARELA